jgi:AcrR family transcriptional regulator
VDGNGGRRYGGQDAGERRDARRRALTAAGLELFGTHGYANVSVKQVCEQARLTQRYFYESFADREALLRAVYDGAVATMQARALAAVEATDGDLAAAAAAGLGAIVRCVTEDERLGRVVLLEVVGVSPALEVHRNEVIHQFAALIQGVARDRFALTGDEERHALAAVALVGASNQLLVDWMTTPHTRSDPDTIRDLLAELFRATFEVMRG